MRTSPHWLEELDETLSLDVLRDLAYPHALRAGHLSEELCELLNSASFKELVLFDIDFSDVRWTPYTLLNARQCIGFFSKLKHLDIGISREELSLTKFMEAERTCSQTNDLFRKYRRGEVAISPWILEVFSRAQRKISRVLGPCPTFSDLGLRFGPGATRGVRRKDSSIRSKIAERVQCSEELLPAVHLLLEELPLLSEVHGAPFQALQDHSERFLVDVDIVPSQVTFQPKSAKALRVACTEPGLNVLLQLGLGDFMSDRLAKHGIGIRDQTANQSRAFLASLTTCEPKLATVDLSSASDTIATELVSELLPLDWFWLLNCARTRSTILPNGEEISQEKFSSMGNGFTFPLETLIFWALTSSLCDDQGAHVTVYGDDIILPSRYYDRLLKVFNIAGFTVNGDKSFVDGPFRESCGKDYYLGTDVRPYFQKEWVSAQTLFVLHNYYVRRGDDELAKSVVSLIHPSLVIYGPDGYGDGHLIGSHEPRVTEALRRKGYSGYLFHTFSAKAKKSFRPLPSDWVCPSYTTYRRASEPLILPQPEGGSTSTWCFLKKWTRRKAGLDLLGYAGTPLPEKEEDGITNKGLALPGRDGYHKISVYTLG